MKADERKKHILDAALKAFAEHGYERTSIAIICEEAGIARPTLYQYFKDKKSVFRELLEDYMLGLVDGLHDRQKRELESGKSVYSPRELLSLFHRELFTEIFNNRDIYMILMKEARARNAETEDIVKGIIKAMVSEFVREVSSSPDFDRTEIDDVEFAGVYMIGGAMGAVEYYLIGREREMTPDEFADKITEIESKIFKIKE